METKGIQLPKREGRDKVNVKQCWVDGWSRIRIYPEWQKQNKKMLYEIKRYL